MPKSYQLAIITKTELVNDAVEFEFQKPKDFLFTAGQYARITLPEVRSDNITDTFHDFSIASGEHEAVLTICTRASDSPFKQSLLKKQVGDVVDLQGPLGVFMLPDTQKAQLIAGGIGITPFYSMVKSYASADITVWYFNESIDRAVYIDELKALASNHIDLKLRAGVPDRASLAGIVSGDRPIMVAGPPGFVKKTYETLMSFAILETDIISESFNGYELRE